MSFYHFYGEETLPLQTCMGDTDEASFDNKTIG